LKFAQLSKKFVKVLLFWDTHKKWSEKSDFLVLFLIYNTFFQSFMRCAVG